jgi:hypothetical protein
MTLSYPQLSDSKLKGANSLEPLPFPVYFICKNFDRWGELINRPDLPKNYDALYLRSASSSDIWSPQTYLALKERGLNVYLSSKYVPGEICITPYDHLNPKHLCFNSYVVACRYDRGRPELCEQRIVLSHLNVVDGTDHFVPHWPQPKLIPRDRSRGTTVQHLDFKGALRNLAYPFQDVSFVQGLEQDLGVTLRYPQDNDPNQVSFWRDYAQTDVLLAVRNATEYDLTLKPAIKLINAWFAGVPAILGPEPAYQQMRCNELDYIEVRTTDEALAALRKLKEQPKLYEAMVENGFARSKELTADKVAESWRALLAGPITDGYVRWRHQNLLQKAVGRPAKFVWKAFKHSQEQRSYFYRINHGKRLFPLPAEEPASHA